FAASIEDSAISFGVTGTCSLFFVVGPAPVTALVIIVLFAIYILSFFFRYIFINIFCFKEFNYTIYSFIIVLLFFYFLSNFFFFYFICFVVYRLISFFIYILS